jgi:hypothetical protein
MLKRKKQKAEQAARLLTGRAAVKIAGGISYLQNGFATFMNKKTSKLSQNKWKVLIIVFAIGWGALSLRIIINAFAKHPVVFKSSNIQFIIKPVKNDSLAILEQIYEQRKK